VCYIVLLAVFRVKGVRGIFQLLQIHRSAEIEETGLSLMARLDRLRYGRVKEVP
jgi:hypothetical protein